MGFFYIPDKETANRTDALKKVTAASVATCRPISHLLFSPYGWKRTHETMKNDPNADETVVADVVLRNCRSLKFLSLIGPDCDIGTNPGPIDGLFLSRFLSNLEGCWKGLLSMDFTASFFWHASSALNMVESLFNRNWTPQWVSINLEAVDIRRYGSQLEAIFRGISVTQITVVVKVIVGPTEVQEFSRLFRRFWRTCEDRERMATQVFIQAATMEGTKETKHPVRLPFLRSSALSTYNPNASSNSRLADFFIQVGLMSV
jgi:hypothetical protein